MNKLYLQLCLSLSLLYVPQYFLAQNPSVLEIEGRVVEMVAGKPVGVPDIEVGISDQDYSFTDEEGRFRLTIDLHYPQTKLHIVDQHFKMLSPLDGLIPVPPGGQIHVAVCGAENRRLRQKVEQMAARVRRMQSEGQLQQRQLQRAHQTMLDTILHFERQMAQYDQQIQEYSTTSQIQKERILALQDELDRLVNDLADALQQKFQRQLAVYDQLSADLHLYLDRVYNLRDAHLPSQVNAYFLNALAFDKYSEVVTAYNDARRPIVDRHEKYIAAVGEYWENADLQSQLADLYAFILVRIHDQTIYPTVNSVREPLSGFYSRQLGRAKAQKAANAGAAECVRSLNPLLEELSRRLNQIVDRLGEHL